MACLSERAVYGVSFLVALQHSDKYFEPHWDMVVLVGAKSRALL
jgi:hypothetical protein